MVGLRLLLPKNWTNNPARLRRAHVPGDHQPFRSKPKIAIAEIDRIMAAGVRFGCMLADAGHGLSAPFRQTLSARGLRWAVGIPRQQKVYPADVALIFPVSATADSGKNLGVVSINLARQPACPASSGRKLRIGAHHLQPFKGDYILDTTTWYMYLKLIY